MSRSGNPDNNSPSYEAVNNNEDIQEVTLAKRGCCFWIPFLNPTEHPSNPASGLWQRIKSVDSNPTTPPSCGGKDSWWVRSWKRLREWSEVVAGPKWKTFLRKFNNNNNNNNKNKNNGIARRDVCVGTVSECNGSNYSYTRHHIPKFQYDPHSYALNFDEGPGGQNGLYDDDDIAARGFSSRYSLPPSTKSSLDFDRHAIFFT